MGGAGKEKRGSWGGGSGEREEGREGLRVRG